MFQGIDEREKFSHLAVCTIRVWTGVGRRGFEWQLAVVHGLSFHSGQLRGVQGRGLSTDVAASLVFSAVSSRLTSTSTRRYEVSGWDHGNPVSPDVRFTDEPSRPSCLPNMPGQIWESGGSFSASEPVVFSESHDVNDMRSQVAFDDPNGPRAPLRSNFDDPDGWEPTESPDDQLSFHTRVVGQTGEVHRRDPVAYRPIFKCRTKGCAGSCTPPEVVRGYHPGKETVTCKICETTFPRYNVTLSDFDSCQNASLVISRRPNWVS